LFVILSPKLNEMFGWLFKKKTEREKLELEYKRLMVESFELSKVNRTASDEKVAEADKISKMIDELDAKEALKS
jgi:hypothetical protein